MKYDGARTADNADDAIPALDRLRVVLDTASIRRRMLRVEPAETSLHGVATFLGVSAPDIVSPTIVEADGDYLAVLGLGGKRVALTSIAETVGAKRVRLPGPRRLRAWLARFQLQAPEAAAPPALEWWEVPFITGLPTVMERSLLSRQFVYASTGDRAWVARIAPEELRRATVAQIAEVHGRRSP